MNDAVERVAREALGRLTALLARRSGDLATAEDALSAALVAAMEQWPAHGVPDDPEAWLYTVARRRLVGQWRKTEVRRRKADALRVMQAVEPAEGGAWPDERLPLLFVCAHPAIAPAARAPLMLNTVLGLTAEELAPLLGASSKTMGQRLWRAKTKIREACIPFDVPEAAQLAPRVSAVLDAVYGLYATGAPLGALADEAVWLSRVLAELLPREPEVLGLRALLLYVHARRHAARVDGRYVPLDEQDAERWDALGLARADQALRGAHACGLLGPFQLEAALQSALVEGARRGEMDHGAIAALYEALLERAPTHGLAVGRAAHLLQTEGAAVALRRLDAIHGCERFQPWWAVRAACQSALGRGQEADAAYARAIELTRDPAVRAWLEHQRRTQSAPGTGAPPVPERQA